MPLTHARPNLALYLAGILILAMLAYGPIPQLVNYHQFADQRIVLGLPHGGDVLSNFAFLAAAAYGAFRMRSASRVHPAQALFVAALALTAAGSTWYHLAPDNVRLVWDRLPIALACAALLAAAIKEAYPRLLVVLAALVLFGLFSVWWWAATGDLRPYLLIQLTPLVLIPLLQWQSRAPIAQRTAFVMAIILYVVAKMCELADLPIYEAFGALSGHTLKHLMAALAAIILVCYFSVPGRAR